MIGSARSAENIGSLGHSLLHDSIRTEFVYVHWVRSHIRFHDPPHPATLGSDQVTNVID